MRTRGLLWWTVLGLLVGGQAWAYKIITSDGGAELHWNASDIPVVWRTESGHNVASDGAKSLAWANVLAAFTAAHDVWQAVPCTTFAFKYGGDLNVDMSKIGSATPDGQNVMAFPDRDFWADEPSWSNAYAVTLPLHQINDGRILDADMLFNPNFNWDTRGDGSTDYADLQNIATHEVGHVFGLDHPPGLDATMYYASYMGETYKRTLAPDDIQGICHLYPKARALASPCKSGADCDSGQCEADTASGGSVCTTGCRCPVDCPTSLQCRGGLCLPPGPDVGGVGDPCSLSLPCESGSMLCVSYMCSVSCTSDASCPDGFSCADLVGGGKACYTRTPSTTHRLEGPRPLLRSVTLSSPDGLGTGRQLWFAAVPETPASDLLTQLAVKIGDGAFSSVGTAGSSASLSYTPSEEGDYTVRVNLYLAGNTTCPQDFRDVTFTVGVAPPLDGDTDSTYEREHDYIDEVVPDKSPISGCHAASGGGFGIGAFLLLAALWRRRRGRA